MPGAPARLRQHLSLARGKHLPRCPRRETGSRQLIPAAFGCLHAWDIKPASPEREELLEGSPKAPGRLPGALGQLPTHLPLPRPSPGHAGGVRGHGARGSSSGRLSPGAGGGHRPQQPLGLPTQPGSHGGAPVCALGCACLSHCGSVDFRHCKAESTNLHLIKTALCNITYMSLHLTPIILRKAQALFQPVGLRACGADLPGT